MAELHDRLRRQLQISGRIPAIVRDVHEGAEAAAYYTVFREDDVVVAHVDDCATPRARSVTVGFHEACHATAYRKVMLAELPPAALRRGPGRTDCPG